MIGQIKEKRFDPVDFWFAWKVEERYRRAEFFADCWIAVLIADDISFIS